MSMKTIVEALYLLYRAKVPVLLEGVHGIGKTSIGYQLHARIRKQLEQSSDHERMSTLDARDMAKFAEVGPEEFGMWSFSAANAGIEEFIGYPVVDADTRALNYLRSNKFIPPQDHRGGGILMGDELNLSDQSVERAWMSVVLEGRFLDYTMPPNIFVISSQNPATGEYQSRKLNPPTLNRFCQIKVLVKPMEVIEHFESLDFHDSIIDCITENPDTAINPHQDKITFNINQEPTSRSWEFVNRIMAVATEKEIEELGLLVFSGLLGLTTAQVFHKFAMKRGERTIPIDEVLTDYGYDHATFKPDDMGIAEWPKTKIRRRVIKMCKSASVRADLISMALQQLAKRLKDISEEVKTKVQTEGKRGPIHEQMTMEQKRAVVNAMAFLCDLPPDQSGVPFMRVIKNAGFDWTIKPCSKFKIVQDYCRHWDSLNKQAEAQSEATP